MRTPAAATSARTAPFSTPPAPHRSLWLMALMIMMMIAACTEAQDPLGPLELRDPLGLMDVTSDLRVLVFPASSGRMCNADGTLSPALPETIEPEVPDSVIDRRYAVATFPTPNRGDDGAVNVDAGDYVIAIQGWGTDPVTMRMNTLVTQGCTQATLAAGEEQPVTVTMRNIEGMGVCGDSVLSPDEQCEPTTGPFPCDAGTCRTLPDTVNTTTAGTQNAPSVAWGVGSRLIVGFRSDSSEVRHVFRGLEAELVTAPAPLAVDGAIDVDAELVGVQSRPAVSSSPTRVASAFQDVGTGATQGGDVYVRLFNLERAPLSAPILAVPSAGAQTRPRIAMTADGAAIVVFQDAMSPSGVHAVAFEAGATTPGAPIVVGMPGASNPSIDSNRTQMMVVYSQGDSVMAQRFDLSGVAVDATPITVGSTPGSGLPDVALLPDGRAYVVWAAGTGVRGAALDASGVPSAEAELSASGTEPRVAGGSGRFVATWANGPNVEAQYLDGNGEPADNHEQPRTRAPFVVAAGAEPTVAAGGQSQAAVAIAYESGGEVLIRTLPLP